MKHYISLMAALFLGVSLGNPAGAGVLYVSTGGTDNSSCGSSSSVPCRNIDYAVNKASSGDTIKVAAGSYAFANVADPCSAMLIQSVVCVVNKSLTIRGGYSAGSTWIHDPVNNLTEINGSNSYRGVYVYGTGDPNIHLTMQDFTIRNSLVLGPDTTDPYEPTVFGGGMSVVRAAVTLDRIIFQDNRATGAATITVGTAGGAAAGAGLSIRSSPATAISSLTNVRFVSNTSTGGAGIDRGGYAFGALFIFDSEVDVADTHFTGNRALAGAGSGSGSLSITKADALGGAVGVGGNSGVTLTRVYAASNEAIGGSAMQYGGGAFGGAVYVEEAAVAIADSYFWGNVARGATAPEAGFAGGGGVMIYNSNGSVNRSSLIGNQVIGGNSTLPLNSAGVGGGGLYLWRDRADVVVAPIPVNNTLIANNSVTRGSGTNIGGGGGGVQVQGLTANFSHLTLADNRIINQLVAGEGMVIVEAPFVSNTHVTLDNSIVSGHTSSDTPGGSAIVVTQGNTAPLTANTLAFNRGIFSGNASNTNFNGFPMAPGTITGLDTMTTVGSVGYVSPGLPNYNYHISSVSPARDAATGSIMALDVDNQGRVDGLPDLGADEYSAAPTVRLASATYSVNENGGSVTLLIQRLGSTNGAAAVNYSTVSSSATSGADYVSTSGTLSWLSGEPGNKVVVVPILDDPLVESNETFTLTLSNPSGIALGSPSNATVTIMGNDCALTGDTDRDGIPDGVEVVEDRNPCAKDNDIFTIDRLFAMQQYRDFLSREGEPGGVVAWTNYITSGIYTQAQVIDSFFNSPEFGGVVPPVVRLYFAYFQRIPDYVGLLHWVGQYRAGMPLTEISDYFATAPEFITRYGSLDNGQFVTLIYANVLGRVPDPEGYVAWVSRLDSGAMTRGQVMLGFSESTEYQTKSYNSVYVTMMYVGMLRRSPEQAGFDAWVARLNSGMSGLNLINGFYVSPEYRTRFL